MVMEYNIADTYGEILSHRLETFEEAQERLESWRSTGFDGLHIVKREVGDWQDA